MSTEQRNISLLERALGPVICAARKANDVTEIIVNPDGKLWLETHDGREVQDACINAQDAEQVIRLVASHASQSCTPRNPIVSAEMPNGGERFEGLLPPAAAAPCFVIRKPAQRVFTLDDYVASGTITPVQQAILQEAIEERLNIVVAGGTASGKTTFVNALLDEVAQQDDRVILIEDTVELVCSAKDFMQLRTVPGAIVMRDLVKSSLRLRPDRIIIGEVRGAEALDLLKAWNTGHPGGMTTLHANSATSALTRIEQLVLETSRHLPRELIAEAIDLIAFIERTPDGRRVAELLKISGCDQFGDYHCEPATAPAPSLIQPTGDKK